MNIINYNDINKYLSMIKKNDSSDGGATANNPPVHTTPLRRVFIDPAIVVKTLDIKTGQCVKVGGEPDLDKYLSARSEHSSKDTARKEYR
jgi:hypothetical protein